MGLGDRVHRCRIPRRTRSVDGFATTSNQLHRIMGVIDYASELTKAVALDLNIGAGYTLTGTGDRWVVKAIVGVGHLRGGAGCTFLAQSPKFRQYR